MPNEGQYQYTNIEQIEYENELMKVRTDYTMSNWAKEKYLDNISNSEVDSFAKKAVEDIFIRIHKRPLFNEPCDKMPFNGNCLPAQRRLYVTVDGDFRACERVGDAITIGNVFKGIDIEKIRSIYIEQYAQKSKKYCSKCWAARMCNLCYSECYTNDELNMKKKIVLCESTRKGVLEGLILYHECLEKNPDRLKYLNDVVVS